MSWKAFLLIPLAALLAAQPLEAPKLRPPLPALALAGCDYPRARELYLRAFAYSHELPEASRKLLGAAARELAPCAERAPELSRRLHALRRALFP